MTQKTPETIFEKDTEIPNNPKLPVLLYRQLIAQDDKAEIFKARFYDNGWRGIWKGGIFAYHHFHPDAHEALGVAEGKATVMLGGKSGKIFELHAGDLVILPAGTGHKNIAASDDFSVIGAYPAGQENYTICRSLQERPNAREEIDALELPETDPYYGTGGPLIKSWS
tara:strand:- start:232 stop:735 length:504 start_codon:yes stop_codon:yes gene_type:complete